MAISTTLTERYATLSNKYTMASNTFVPQSAFLFANATMTRDVAAISVLCDAISTCKGHFSYLFSFIKCIYLNFYILFSIRFLDWWLVVWCKCSYSIIKHDLFQTINFFHYWETKSFPKWIFFFFLCDVMRYIFFHRLLLLSTTYALLSRMTIQYCLRIFLCKKKGRK